MRILALDTATTACSVAVWEDETVRARRFEMMPRGQSEALIPMVVGVLDEVSLTFGDLDYLAVTVGPGAFTGLRIGLAAARGMALATGLPCLGVTTFDAVAEGIEPFERAGRDVLIALDAKRADVYAQFFSPNLEAASEPLALPPDELAGRIGANPLLIAGDASARMAEAAAARGIEAVLSTAPGVADAAHVAAVAARRQRAGQAGEPPEPLYLRPPDATISPNGGRLRP
ncbi:MAG: tRNA (adenosine(37)-N6)-threonylcarbamoyltransferase complex dimerization subunit type 1 TsaB [Rhodospirillales bacterium]|nr:tRNA (adenosine(37)-N6)-threonylcarbamoyltransferase complex dimerization subunit type 1 TsaB [Rhodospirillales bacterium]